MALFEATSPDLTMTMNWMGDAERAQVRVWPQLVLQLSRHLHTLSYMNGKVPCCPREPASEEMKLNSDKGN